MQFYRTVRDGESQSHAAAGALARLTYAIERLKDVRQLGLRGRPARGRAQ